MLATIHRSIQSCKFCASTRINILENEYLKFHNKFKIDHKSLRLFLFVKKPSKGTDLKVFYSLFNFSTKSFKYYFLPLCGLGDFEFTRTGRKKSQELFHRKYSWICFDFLLSCYLVSRSGPVNFFIENSDSSVKVPLEEKYSYFPNYFLTSEIKG